MKLIHYTNKEFKLEPRVYDQSLPRSNSKPDGLWVSVEGTVDDDQTWKSWCEAEGFRLENLVKAYEVKLKKKAKILHLKTPEEIREFGQFYHLSTRSWDSENDTYHLRWDEVKEKYQGIIIAPYQWECRLGIDTSWYYGWDCASGCIWDLSCIKEIKFLKNLNALVLD